MLNKKWLVDWFKAPQPSSKFQGEEIITRKHFAQGAFEKFLELGEDELAGTNNKYLDWMMNVFLNKGASYLGYKECRYSFP